VGLRSWIVLALVCVASSAGAVELRNDGLDAGQAVRFQAGFVAGEAGAVRLTSPFQRSKLQSVSLFFGGGDAGARDIVLHVWNDAAGTDPGSELFAAAYNVTASDSALQVLDVSADDVVVPATFRVGIELTEANLPSLAIDSDGITANANFINAQGLGWIGAATLGLTGDFIIRAEVTEAPADGGVDAGPDAGRPDAGSPDAGPADSGVPDAGPTPTDAGTRCASNTECATGTYCDTAVGQCTFECRLPTDCGSGSTCNSLGRCVKESASGCGCTSVEPVALGLALLLALRRRR
jgi:hypothetical protein